VRARHRREQRGNTAAALALALVLSACDGAPARGSDSAAGLEVVFVGDVLLAEGAGSTIAQGGDPFTQIDSVLAGALRIGNLECAVASDGKAVNKIFTFRAEPATLDVLAKHFDAVSLANNHSGDFGRGALLQTLSGLEQSRVGYFGAGRTLAAAHEPYLIERAGITLALLGYDEFHPRWFEAGPDWPGVAWSEDEHAARDIRAARARGADVVIPFLHWGWENEPQPCVRQRELARVLIDAGADAVVGAHPHVTQGAEMYRGRPIVYSLGNFVFSLIDYEENRRGWMLRLALDKRGVVRWDTVVVRLDDQGTPALDRDASGPCGRRGSNVVAECATRELLGQP
jgi:Bacterial capsule synthesis protein PGA_cap